MPVPGHSAQTFHRLHPRPRPERRRGEQPFMAGNDWRYYRASSLGHRDQLAGDFSQISGDVVLHVRDTIPRQRRQHEHRGTQRLVHRRQERRAYANYDLPGYLRSAFRPCALIRLTISASAPRTTRRSSEFHHHRQHQYRSAHHPVLRRLSHECHSGQWRVAYRIVTPADAQRWRNTRRTQIPFVLHGERHYPTKSVTDDYRSTAANSTGTVSSRHIRGCPTRRIISPSPTPRPSRKTSSSR